MSDVVLHRREVSPSRGKVRKVLSLADDLDTPLRDLESPGTAGLNVRGGYSIHSIGNHDSSFTSARRASPDCGSVVWTVVPVSTHSTCPSGDKRNS